MVYVFFLIMSNLVWKILSLGYLRGHPKDSEFLYPPSIASDIENLLHYFEELGSLRMK